MQKPDFVTISDLYGNPYVINRTSVCFVRPHKGFTYIATPGGVIQAREPLEEVLKLLDSSKPTTRRRRAGAKKDD